MQRKVEARSRLGRAALVVWLTLAANGARADEPEWLLLPSAVAHEGEGTPIARRAAQHLDRLLAAGTPRLLAPARARARFEQRGSTAPLMVSHSDLDALAHDTQMALYHVASGLPTRARQDVERALARADKVLESLNRESLAAQQLLDACLYLVRAHLQSGDRAKARDQALECKRLVPDIEPDGTMHPPEVIGILAEAEAELRQREPGSLRVESVPEGCAVFINGRHLGEAPYELPQLSPGEYRVQAECEEGRAGRVHRVTIGTARVVKRIDTRFDAAVQTSLDISLRYDSGEAQRLHAYADALEIGRTVGVAEVLLVLPVVDAHGAPSDVVQVDRVRMQDGRMMAAVRMRIDAAGGVDGAALADAVRDLRAGERADHSDAAHAVPIADAFTVAIAPVAESRLRTPAATATRKAPSSSETPAAPPPESVAAAEASASAAPRGEPTELHDERRADTGRPSRPPNALGIALGATGGVATIVGWGLYIRQYNLELGYSQQKINGEDYSATLADLKHSEYAALAVGASGAAVLTASLPWLLPESHAERVPTWAYVLGGAGALTAIAGGYFLVRGATCNSFDQDGRCRDMEATSHLGPQLLVNAVPLLAVPIVYLLRESGDASDTHGVALLSAPAERGGYLVLRGRL